MPVRILIVGDMLSSVKVLEAKLSSEYYEVITARNGRSAFEAVENDDPDLVLLDMMMPGMDGFDVCRRVKQNPKTIHIPVIMITALSGHNDLVCELEARADEALYEAKRAGRNLVVSQASLTPTKAAKSTKAPKPSKKAKTA